MIEQTGANRIALAADNEAGQSSQQAFGPEIRYLLDLLWAARRRKWLVLICACCGAALGYLYALQSEVQFRGETRLWVQAPDQSVLPSGGDMASAYGRMDYYSMYAMLSTQMAILKTPVVVNRAIEDFNLLKRLPKGVSISAIDTPASLSAYIRATLDIERGGGEGLEDANVIRVGFSSPDRDFTILVLDAITSAYRSFVTSTSEDKTKEAVELIGKAHKELLKDMENDEAEYQAFQNDHNLPLDISKVLELRANSLAAKSAAMNENEIKLAKLRATLNSLDQLTDNGADEEVAEILATSALGFSSALNIDRRTIEEQLLPLLANEKKLTAKFGNDHPSLIQIRELIALNRKVLENSAPGRFSKTNSELADNGSHDFGEGHSVAVKLREALREQIKSLEEEYETLQDLYLAEQSEAKELQDLARQEVLLRTRIGSTKRLFDGTVEQLNQINLVQDVQQSGAMEIRVLAEPESMGATTPGAVTKAFGGGAFGIAIAVMLANLLERAHRKLHSLEDVRNCLSTRTVVDVPQLQEKDLANVESDTQFDPVIQAFHRPRSRFAEQFRKLRTSLMFATAGGERIQTIQVTSSVPSEGKSLIAANLAVTMARSDKRVILVDADVRRPKMGHMFGYERTRGLVDVLRQEADLSDVVQATEVTNLSILAAGSTGDDSADVLTFGTFGTLLDRLRKEYDIVILDSPPILAVSDPDLLAAQVDAVVFSVRIDSTPYATVRHCQQWMQSNGLQVTVAVANGVGGQKRYGGGYYGGYYYGGNGYYSANEDYYESGELQKALPR